MMRIVNFLFGFMTGVILGGAIAVLFAPQAGRDTQEYLRARFQEIADEARRAAETTRTEAEIRLADLKAGPID
jgi:gas vesicle protein